ncbi:hypothetical protein EIP91_002231 [Steccherinum ochraceum]|uniref:Uncharacterized protein n=1 Tax=Steccherinum ochraceum TaxID=92696 RepID=A0A4V2MWC4_9APHY|nr:hypothetical protein EIP91_002231 [Steccherinum ochraceum]
MLLKKLTAHDGFKVRSLNDSILSLITHSSLVMVSYLRYFGVLDETSLLQARYSIEQEITSQLRKASALRTRFNDLLPVSWIPWQILVDIFSMVLVDMASPTVKYKYSWLLTITHVCRRWRQAALSVPELWATITAGEQDDHPSCIHAFLSRSQQSSLSINATYWNMWSLTALQLAIPAIHRAETVEFRFLGNTPHEIHYVSALLPREAPRLLSLDVSANDRSSEHGLPFDCVDFAHVLHGCATPKLRRLRITGFKIDWKHRAFPLSLTELEVRRASFKFGDVPSQFDVVSALSSLPALQSLHLLDTFPHLHVTTQLPPREVTTPVPLGRLRDLRLSGQYAMCAHFLEHVSLPAATCISLQFNAVCSDASSHILVIPLRNKLLESTDINPMPPIGMLSLQQGGLDIFLQRSESVPSFVLPRLKIRYAFREHHSLALGPFLGSLVKQLPLRGVPILCITDLSTFPDAKMGWTAVFTSMPDVQTLFLRATRRALCRDVVSVLDAIDDQYRFVFQRLRKVVLEGISMRRPYFPNDPPGLDVVDLLCMSLSARTAAGIPIKELVLQRCSRVDRQCLYSLQADKNLNVMNK